MSDLNERWGNVLKLVKEKFGEVLDVKSIVFLIGVQELGHGFRDLNKNEKIDAMHVGICSLFQPYGYYIFLGRDKDGWPHWEVTEKIKETSGIPQEILLKEAIINYFELNA